MATALEKRPAEIIRVESNFAPQLSPTGDTIINGNVDVTITLLATGEDVTADVLVAGSLAISGALVSCRVQAGAVNDVFVVTITTGLTTQNRTYEDVTNVLVTNFGTAGNLLCSLAFLKSRLKPADDSDDTLLGELLESASEYIRTRCMRDFAVQTYTEDVYLERRDPYQERLRLHQWPIQRLISLTLIDSELFEVVVNAANVGVDKEGFIWLRPAAAESWRRFPGTNRVVYLAGYPRIPFDLQEACRSICIWFYRRVTKEGLKSETIRSYSYSLQSLSDVPQSQRHELPVDDVESVISKYRRQDLT